MANFDPQYFVVFATCCSGVLWFFKTAQRIGKIELQLETLWDFHIRRGISDALSKGYMTKNSPLIATEEVAQLYAPILSKMRTFYRKNRTKSDRQLFYEIERNFGDELVKAICTRLQIHSGACVVMALELLKKDFYKREV